MEREREKEREREREREKERERKRKRKRERELGKLFKKKTIIRCSCGNTFFSNNPTRFM